MGQFLGIDIGSVSVKVAVIDDNDKVVYNSYKRHQGKPQETAVEMLAALDKEVGYSKINNAALTGIGATISGQASPVEVENEIICQAKAAALFYPDTRSIIEIGGQDSKLILIDYDRDINQMVIKDFAMNTICAAGTGSFLDQQASRLKVNIEKEFGELSLNSAKPPRIAGRCSVFAKTDMIHLQQEATPVHDILAGLCFAVARNFVSCIARGKKIITPCALHGGVASNVGMVRAFKEILGIPDKDLRIHEHHRVMGAVGAAVIAKENSEKKSAIFEPQTLEQFLKRSSSGIQTLQPLRIKMSKTSTSPVNGYIPREETGLTGYLGIDIGSISTNLVVIDDRGRVLSKRYLMTAGRPIEAVRKGLAEIKNDIQNKVTVRGVCTTGSGRYLIGDFFGADVVKNEITAQATAAAAIDPAVDTIFEIGGQDSKYISLEKGAIVDFEMNKVCAAGTGSFLEEQAEKLGINIKKEFGLKALRAKQPCAMGERCTVFIETDMVSNQQKGAKTDDLVAGLAYSIVYNYLNKVVGDRKVGNRIFFQGGTAYNDAVVAAFEAVTGKRITVPDHHEVTGAIGCALIARRWHKETNGLTRFKGFERGNAQYQQDSFECKACSNHCEINRIKIEGEETLFYGGRCEKYEVRRKKDDGKIPDLFKEREELLLKEYNNQPDEKLKGTIGIPRILYNFEYMPYWTKFFKELGYKVVISDPTNKEIINEGLEKVLAEACFPVKVAHGHLLNLLGKEIDYLFMPSVVGMKIVYKDYKESAPCPYGQAIPYILRAAFDLDKQDKIKLITPTITFSEGKNGVINGLRKIADDLGVKFKEIRKAVDAAESAQEEFYAAIQKRGKEILANLTEEDRAVVIISRPYNGCDQGINLDLPRKLRDLDALAVPMDFLPLDDMPISEDWPFMTWRYGQKFIAAADIIREDKRLNAMFITNFGCGPDSFLMKFFRKRMGGKVYLQIEVDEHSADVGAITRCEAFLDSIENIREKEAEKYTFNIHSLVKNGHRRTLYIPNMCDHAHVLKAAFQANGVPAVVMPESNLESLYHGRKYTTGKECYPCIVTTGDMLRLINSKDFDPDKVAFFMPGAGGGCRFGYYNILQRIVLDEVGHPEIPIYSPHQTDSFLEDLGENVSSSFFREAWNGIVAADLLDKALRETRPYELKKGETYEIYWEYLQKLCNGMMKKQDIIPIMQQARRAFEKIEINRAHLKPVIGIVGEIYVRSHRFSNNYIVEALESLGAEVWVSPFFEWLLYVNVINKEDRLNAKDMLGFARLYMEDVVAKNDKHKLIHIWDGFLRSANEPSAEDNIKSGSDYVDPSFRGETILSLGKAVDFYKSGLSGIINVMPFTCMPGTVVNAMLRRLKENCEDIPVLNVAYDGLDMSNNLLRLEAFVHQCGQYMQRNLLAEAKV